MKTMKTGLMMVAGTLLLSACAPANPPLYYWGNYQDQVYQHFKTQDPQQEIAVLEEDLQKARAKGLNSPPGFHAHLGLLYAQTEQHDQAMQNFSAEKMMYPESTQYMDFLMRGAKQ